jgi:hypothetical protein
VISYLAPLAGRGRREATGEGDSPRVRVCRGSPSPRPSPREERGEGEETRAAYFSRRATDFTFQTARHARTRPRDLAAAFCSSLARISHPLKAEGAGNTGRSMRPIAACAMVVAKRTRVSRSHRIHPAFPAQWFTAYIALSPATGLFCHRRPWSCLHELDTSVGVSGPHDFAVRLKRPRQKRHPRPPHPAPRS